MKNYHRVSTADTTAHQSSTTTITVTPNIVCIELHDIYDLFEHSVFLRKEHLGMSQQDLAKKLGCSRSKVSFAENHPEDISLEYWYQFAKLLGLELQAPTFASLEERREEALKRYKPWWKRLLSKLIQDEV